MLTCPRCNLEAYDSDQKICTRCGWDFSEKVIISTHCVNCNSRLPELAETVNVCPNCRAYLAYNREELDPKLVKIALEWRGPTRKFCVEVLEISIRVTNSLLQKGLYPIEILALDEMTAVGYIRNFGQKAYEELDYARKGWSEK